MLLDEVFHDGVDDSGLEVVPILHCVELLLKGLVEQVVYVDEDNLALWVSQLF